MTPVFLVVESPNANQESIKPVRRILYYSVHRKPYFCKSLLLQLLKKGRGLETKVLARIHPKINFAWFRYLFCCIYVNTNIVQTFCRSILIPKTNKSTNCHWKVHKYVASKFVVAAQFFNFFLPWECKLVLHSLTLSWEKIGLRTHIFYRVLLHVCLPSKRISKFKVAQYKEISIYLFVPKLQSQV